MVPGPVKDTAIVRLFGFGDRDRLFSMIDSILPRTSADSSSVTRAELSDSELRSLLKLNRGPAADTELDNIEENSTTSSESEVENEATFDEATSSNARGTSDDAKSSTTNESGTPPTDPRPLSQRPASSGRSVRRQRDSVRASNKQASSAFSDPLAIALATSLASTLRERTRREKEVTNPRGG